MRGYRRASAAAVHDDDAAASVRPPRHQGCRGRNPRADKADVTIAYKFSLPTMPGQDLDGQSSDVWSKGADGLWCKEDEPLVSFLPPHARVAAGCEPGPNRSCSCGCADTFTWRKQAAVDRDAVETAPPNPVLR